MIRFTKVLIVLSTFLSAGLRAEVTVEEPYVRAMPPGQTVTGAFMQLHNVGAEDRLLVSASSPAAGVVELHTHVSEDGMMKMRQIPRIEVPAGAMTPLKPGGLHVMLIDVPTRLQAGDTVDIVLHFDDDSRQTITAPVKTVMGGMKHGQAKGKQGSGTSSAH